MQLDKGKQWQRVDMGFMSTLSQEQYLVFLLELCCQHGAGQSLSHVLQHSPDQAAAVK